jgi:hypothetical protein
MEIGRSSSDPVPTRTDALDCLRSRRSGEGESRLTTGPPSRHQITIRFRQGTSALPDWGFGRGSGWA